MKTKILIKLIFGLIASIGFAAAGHAQTQGVSDTEILVGTHTALSGPVAGWGIPVVKAIRLRFDEENGKGGIYGRKLRLIAEDHQYNVAIAVQKANKLVNQDKVFFMIGSLGTPMNQAAFKMQFAKNIPNIFPGTQSRSMVEPLHKLKYMSNANYYSSGRDLVKYYAEKKGKKRFCVMAIDSDHGQETVDAVNDQLKAMNMKTVAITRHKATETNFAAHVMKLRSSGCDCLVLGTIIRDTIIGVNTVRKLGWDVDIVGDAGITSAIVPGKGGPAMEGLVAVYFGDILPETPVSERGRRFVEGYREKYGEKASREASVGYIFADLAVLGIKNAGPNLTVDSLVKGIESIKNYKSPFLGPDRNFGPHRHHGSEESFLMVVKDGKWVLPNGKIEYLGGYRTGH